MPLFELCLPTDLRVPAVGGKSHIAEVVAVIVNYCGTC